MTVWFIVIRRKQFYTSHNHNLNTYSCLWYKISKNCMASAYSKARLLIGAVLNEFITSSAVSSNLLLSLSIHNILLFFQFPPLFLKTNKILVGPSSVLTYVQIKLNFMFFWPCISIYSCKENQLDALFILSIFRQSTCTCFGRIHSPSSGHTPCIYVYIYIQGLSKRFEHLLLWPPRSPDLTPCDFFLWGYVKDNAYKPQTARSHSSCGANHWRGTS